MWDFHSHILPGLDDGAEDIKESLAMAKIAVEEGIHTMIATPHYIPKGSEISKEDVIKASQDFNTILQQNNIPLEVLPGMEVFVDWDILKKIDEKKILSIQNTRYILIELPMQDIPVYIEDLFYELEIRDLVPILAHPERYRKIQENPNLLIDWIQRGVFMQINTSSLTGILGQRAQETAGVLLKHNMVHILGTDAHTARRRSPRIQKTIQYIQETIEGNQARILLEENPKKLLADERIQAIPPIEVRKKKSFLSFFRGKRGKMK